MTNYTLHSPHCLPRPVVTSSPYQHNTLTHLARTVLPSQSFGGGLDLALSASYLMGSGSTLTIGYDLSHWAAEHVLRDFQLSCRQAGRCLQLVGTTSLAAPETDVAIVVVASSHCSANHSLPGQRPTVENPIAPSSFIYRKSCRTLQVRTTPWKWKVSRTYAPSSEPSRRAWTLWGNALRLGWRKLLRR